MSSPSLSPGLQVSKQVAWTATVALVGSAYFALAIVVLHLLRPDHNPIRQVTSEYAVGPYGFVMTSAFFSMSLASIALVMGLYYGVAQPGRSRIGLGLLGLWGVGLLIAMIFPIDAGATLDGAPQTLSGTIHGINGPLAFLSVTLGVLLLSRRFKHDTTWHPFHRPALMLSLVILAGFIALPLQRFLAVPEFVGLTQRIVLVAVVVWYLLTASRLRSMALRSGTD